MPSSTNAGDGMVLPLARCWSPVLPYRYHSFTGKQRRTSAKAIFPQALQLRKQKQQANNADKAVNNVASTDAPAVEKPAKQEPGFTTSYADNIQKIFTADNTDNTDPQTASLNTLPVTSPVESTATANDDASAVQPDLAVNSIQPQVKFLQPNQILQLITHNTITRCCPSFSTGSFCFSTGADACWNRHNLLIRRQCRQQRSKKLAEENSDLPDMKRRLAKAASEKKAGKKKVDLAIVTPTVSYRSLTENMEYSAPPAIIIL